MKKTMVTVCQIYCGPRSRTAENAEKIQSLVLDAADDEQAILAARWERMMKVFPARALDNGMYLAMVDQVAREGPLAERLPGKSMVFDPYGDLLAEAGGWEEQTLRFEFDPERLCGWRESRFFGPNNFRPDIYRKHLRHGAATA